MEPLVSIVCCAYNQERYIRDALDGFIMQKTDFPFEVLIHDDASSDGTADIIREYERKYPGLVKPVYQTENQYSKGVNIPLIYQYSRAKGKYTAICEGDDYWTDPMKLQRQVDALEAHPEIDICACSADVTEHGKFHSRSAPAEADTVFTPEEVIRGGGTFVSTCSILIRSDVLRQMSRFRQTLPCDYAIQIQGSLRGGLLYLSDRMCVYRLFSNGSWTSMYLSDSEKRAAFDSKMQKMLNVLDEETGGEYSEAIQYKLTENEFYSLNNNCQFREMMEPRFRRIYMAQSPRSRLKLRIRCMFPGAIRLYRRVRSKLFRSGK